MEAVPKLPLIDFELKVSTENPNFGSKLKQYISEAYREDLDSYSNEIHQLEGLRSAAVRPSIDSAGLAAMTRYFCQLRAIQSRFPMGKGQPVACTFTWKDLYASMGCTLPDVNFEMACILYNIGALHTQLGASEPRTSPESLKIACTHYQNAAWAFQYIREHYPQPQCVDVSNEMCRFLQEICFAQAQECILEKSIQDANKPSVVGAVATQVMFFYKNSLAYLGPSTGSDNIHEIIGTKLYNYWHRYLSFKASYIGCLVCLYQGMNAEEQQKMGERVAFYQLAVEKLNEAGKLAKYIEPVQITQEALTFTNDVVEGKRKAAKNENEFIYHEEVPDKDLLADLKPANLVKALPINLNDPEVSGPDLFARLVPMGAHEASSMYSEEKAKLLRHIVGQAEAKNTELTEFMSSLQLNQLDVLDSDQKIPQEIVDRCAVMNAKTEIIQTLVDSMNNLAEIITDVEHSLAEIKTLIHEETLKEKDYQKVMGARPPSIVQTELSREYHKYQEAHTRTNESNQVLHKAMTLHIANLRLLSQPLDVLQSKIPSIDNIEGLDRDTMNEMRRVVGKAREMQTQRDTLINQLREALTSDDITAQLLARTSEPAEDIFKEQLEKHTPKVKIIEQNLAAQENIINKLTSLYASYGESRRLLSDVLRKREGLINALVTSYDSHQELLAKSQKGIEFYKKLSHNVNQLLTRLRSTCQVQEEERQQLLSKQTIPASSSKAASPPLSTTPKSTADITAPPEGTGLKLKDYLPYMKNRGFSRNVAPMGSTMDQMPTDTFYPESIYPTSVRPTPVGSEATDVAQMNLPDGAVPSAVPNVPYNKYGTLCLPPETDPYSFNYPYKAYDREHYGYFTPYIPPQHSSHVVNPQTYTDPYYSAIHDNPTSVTDSQIPIQYQQTNTTNQYNQYDPHNQKNMPEVQPISYSAPNQMDLNTNFSQMQVSVTKNEPNVSYGTEYSNTFHSVNYQDISTPNMATYSHAAQSSLTNSVPSHIPTDFNSLNYPYMSDPTNQYQNPAPSNYGADSFNQHQNHNAANIYGATSLNQYQNPVPSNVYGATSTSQYQNTTQSNNYGADSINQYQSQYSSLYSSEQPHYYEQNPTTINTIPTESQYYPTSSGMDNTPHGYPISNSEVTISTSTSTIVPQFGTYPDESTLPLPNLDALDKPIKSHVTGEALTAYQPVSQSYGGNPVDTSQPECVSYYQDQNVNANVPTYQNHPGYTYNTATGAYDYNYGSQNSYSGYENPGQAVPQSVSHFTSAGTYETVQSPSGNSQIVLQNDQSNNTYYNSPYGYQTASQAIPTPQSSDPTNYSSEMNQSTYMQSDHGQATTVTYSQNQVSTPPDTVLNPPDFNQNSQNYSNVKEEIEENVVAVEKKEPSTFDLLSDIDFSVEHKPLTPEIKVPPVSESAIKKSVCLPKSEPPKVTLKEEVIERPAKRDLFSDPSLVNTFTQEVKSLQKLVDSFTNKTPSGLTVLDSKWKTFHDLQAKENTSRSKSVAAQHSGGSLVTEVVPYDDSRVTLKSDPYAYINASHYKQIAPWCIPLVISKCPIEKEYTIFWKSILENKITCIICLLSEIEMQGVAYWPTAKGQSIEFSDELKVTLEEVTCTVHWTERRLTLATGRTAQNVIHYQINVFPAKIVCSPLVLLADKILNQTYDNRLSNQLSGVWVQCETGAGRCVVVALLLATMCQVRAGQIDLCDMLDTCCINLLKHRTNVLEDTKYLADAYRTALFYVQGVICSGTTMFNGEAVTVPSGASVLPPVTPTPATTSTNQKSNKFTRESFEEMKQSPGLTSGDMKDPLNFLDPLWSLKKK